MDKKKIMIVDDEDVVLESFKRGVKAEGYEIITAISAKDAFNKLRLQPGVKVVVADIKMPGMNGMEFLKILKRENPYIIRIVLTGYADVENAIAAVNEGQVYRFITKPWDAMELRIVLRLALEHQQALEEFRPPLKDVQGSIENVESLEKRYPGISKISTDDEGRVII